MFADAYFDQAIQSLLPLYVETEARALLFLVYEETLLIKRQHLRLINKELSTTEEMKLDSILSRLKIGEPIQYVLGRAWFNGLPLTVNPSVLIPRQETEELVEWVHADLKKSNGEITLLDIGTGSGCIALALKQLLPSATVHALDKSEEALITAQANSKNLNLPVIFHKLDILEEEIDPEWGTQIWVSNPPYIPEKEKKEMHVNVLWFEPASALFVPDGDPLIFYRVILEKFKRDKLAKQLYFEVSEFQTLALEELVKSLNLAFEFRRDLHGKDRFLRIHR